MQGGEGKLCLKSLGCRCFTSRSNGAGGSVRGRCVGAPEAVRLVRFGCTGEGEKQIELSNMLHNAVCLTLLYFPYNFHSLFYFVKNTYKTLFHWEGVFLRSSDES